MKEKSEIQDFYENQSVLITGSTGFLGRVLLEKLLRSCPYLTKIYLLIRPKNTETIETRLENLLLDKLFDNLRKTQKNFHEKIVPISGDLTKPYLNLTEENLNELTQEISIVFHAAAATNYTEALSVATIINIFGTLELLKLAANMNKLKCFLYVSSAFSFAPLKIIEEKVYSGRITPIELLSLMEYENAEEKFNKLEEQILNCCPNVISFTKGLTENLIKEYGEYIPVVVFRPSIIISSYQEPYKNYSFNNTPSKIISSALNGLLKSVSCDPDGIANVVPVDLTVNCMITIPWEISKTYKPPTCKVNDTIPVYHFESSNKPITWKYFFEESTKNGLKYPPLNADWCCSLSLRKNKLVHCVFVIQRIIPAVFYDVLLFVFGRKDGYFEKIMRVVLMNNSMEFLMKNHQKFVSKNVGKLSEKMSIKDKEIFNFDLGNLCWEEYFQSYFLGIRLWDLKDPISTVKNARKRYLRYKIANGLFNVIYGILFLYINYYLIVYFFLSD